MNYFLSNTKNYTEFPEISLWMDSKKIFKQLENGTTFRYSNDTLENFHDTMQTSIINAINSTEVTGQEINQTVVGIT